MLQLPPNPQLRLPLDWELKAAQQIGFGFPRIGWREEDCTTCRGTKVVRTWEGAPLHSEVVEFPCNCVEQMLLHRHLGMRGITKAFRTKGFKDLYWVKPEVRATLAEWNTNPVERAQRTLGLILTGDSDGKTLIATLLQRLLIVNGMDAFLLPMSAFTAEGVLNNWKHEAYEEVQEFWHHSIRGVPMLIIDHIEGAAMANDWVKAKLDNLIRFRAENEMMTIITAKSPKLVRGSLPAGSDLVDTFGVLSVLSDRYPKDEIDQRELAERISRPVVLG